MINAVAIFLLPWDHLKYSKCKTIFDTCINIFGLPIIIEVIVLTPQIVMQKLLHSCPCTLTYVYSEYFTLYDDNNSEIFKHNVNVPFTLKKCINKVLS